MAYPFAGNVGPTRLFFVEVIALKGVDRYL